MGSYTEGNQTMILVKTKKETSKHKIKKFDVVTDCVCSSDDMKLVDSDNMAINTLYRTADDHIKELNRSLEKARLLSRLIECSYCQNNQKTGIDENSLISRQEKRTKGKFCNTINSNNGIFIHH